MSVFADFQVNGLFPSTVGGLGATVKYFPRILGSSIGATPATPSSSEQLPQRLLLLGTCSLQQQEMPSH